MKKRVMTGAWSPLCEGDIRKILDGLQGTAMV
jgi:hypothetical protein